jgi:hypothetical protein
VPAKLLRCLQTRGFSLGRNCLITGQVHGQPKLLKTVDRLPRPASELWSFSPIGSKLSVFCR